MLRDHRKTPGSGSQPEGTAPAARFAAASCALLVTLTLAGCEYAAPELELLTNNLTSEVVKNEANEDDWAYVYTVQVRNVGHAGKIRATGRITTPQGQFYREQVVALESDVIATIRFVYTEPNFIADILAPETRSTYEFSYAVVR